MALKVDVKGAAGEWLRLLEGGEASDKLLQQAGLNPAQYSAVGVGLGLDRLVMAIKNIKDIRILRSTHSFLQQQLLALTLYHPFFP